MNGENVSEVRNAQVGVEQRIKENDPNLESEDRDLNDDSDDLTVGNKKVVSPTELRESISVNKYLFDNKLISELEYLVFLKRIRKHFRRAFKSWR